MKLRALLVGDRRFLEIEGSGAVFSEGPKGPETGERYLEWFDTVTVAGRRDYAEAKRSGQLNRIEAPGLDVVFLPNISGIKARLRNLAPARRKLQTLILQADAVIVRLPTELGREAAHLAMRAGKPLAVEIGGCAFDDLRSQGSIQGKLYAPLAYLRTRAVVRQSHWASYVTHGFLQGRYPAATGARTVACSNVDIPDESLAPLERRLESIGASGEPIIFGTVGSLHGKFKGVQHAIAALGSVADRLPPFRYRVLGGGDPAPWQQLAAQHGLEDKVEFCGTLPAGAAVRSWLDDIDVYLQPSLREGLPRALIEAMSRACPAIASNVAGIPELLPPTQVHAPGDVSALGALILGSVANDTRVRLAEQNFQRSRDFIQPKLAAIRADFWGAFRDHAASLKR